MIARQYTALRSLRRDTRGYVAHIDGGCILPVQTRAASAGPGSVAVVIWLLYVVQQGLWGSSTVHLAAQIVP